jgi:hypothetical protein
MKIQDKRYWEGKKWMRVRPREFKGFLLNPHKGMATFQGFNGGKGFTEGSAYREDGPVKFAKSAGRPKYDKYPPSSIAYCRWFWNQIESEKGKRRWEIIDGALKSAVKAGQNLAVRLMPNGSWGNRASAPDWYRKCAPVFHHNEHPEHFFPDYDSQEYYELWSALIADFAGRYDGHPNIDFIDAAYIGSWGEGAVIGNGVSTQQIQRIADVYLKHHKKTPIASLSNDTQFKYMTSKGTGWRIDCFGDCTCEPYKDIVPEGLRWNHMHDVFPRMASLRPVAWENGPVVLETCWVVGHWYKYGWDIDWILEQGLKYHPSVLMAKSSPIPSEWMPKILDFCDRIGYRFVLRQIMVPTSIGKNRKFHFSMWVENTGAAPLYHEYDLAFRLRQGTKNTVVRSKTDPKNWLPGDNWIEETLDFSPISHGKVEISIGIVPKNSNHPKIKFAINGLEPDGWYVLSEFDVE